MFDQDFRAIDWPSNRKFIIIGIIDGVIYLVDLENKKVCKKFESIFYSGKDAKIDPKTIYMKNGFKN